MSEVVDSSLIIFCRFEKKDEASVSRALISKLYDMYLCDITCEKMEVYELSRISSILKITQFQRLKKIISLSNMRSLN